MYIEGYLLMDTSQTDLLKIKPNMGMDKTSKWCILQFKKDINLRTHIKVALLFQTIWSRYIKLCY